MIFSKRVGILSKGKSKSPEAKNQQEQQSFNHKNFKTLYFEQALYRRCDDFIFS